MNQQSPTTLSPATIITEAVFRGIANRSPDLVFCKDREGRYSYVNAASAKFFGQPVEAILGRLPADFFEAETAEIITQLDRRTLAGEEINLTRELDFDDNRLLLQLIQAPLRDEHGAIIGLAGTIRDQTVHRAIGSALLDSERRSKALLDASPVPMMVLAEDGVIEYLNHAFAATLGYTLKEMSRIDNWWPLAFPVPEERERHRQAFAEVRDAGGDGRSLSPWEWTVATADGNQRTLIAAYCPVGTQGLLTLQDQTEVLNSARHAREQGALLRSITDSAKEAIFVKNRDLRYTFVNPAMATMLGAPRAEILGCRAEDFFPPQEAVTIATSDHQTLAGESVEAIRELTPHGHSQPRVLHTMRTPLHNEAGEITGLCGIIRDVTAQQRIDRMLNFTQFTVNHVNTAVLWLDALGRVVHGNHAACFILGYSLEELYALQVHQLAPELDFAEWRKVWGKPPRRHAIFRELELVAKSTERIPVELTGNHLAYEGQDYACCFISDMRGRHQEQAAFRRLGTAVEQAAESIMITDPGGIIEYVNPAFTKLTGYTRDQVVGHKANLLKSDQQDPETHRHLWQTISSGQTWRGRLINRKQDGSLYEEDAVISPVRDAQDRIVNYVAVKRDVTQEVAMERQLRQAQKMQAIGSLAGGVAHDFNNLIMVITNCAKFARDNLPDDTPVATDLDQIVEASRRAAALTRQLLAFSRRQPLARRIEDLGRIVRELEKMLRRLLRESLVLKLTLPDQPCLVKVDVGQIEQVLVNLAVNASEAIPSTGTLSLRVEAEVPLTEEHRHLLLELPPHPKGKFARISIVDTGTGMTPEVLGHAFDPFFTTKPGGTGLGLATVYGIIRQHDGVIGVTSQIGYGSEFFIYLPMEVAEAEMAEQDEIKQVVPQGHETLLLVEDNAMVRRVAQRILVDLGYRVLEASDGQDAMTVIQQHSGRIDLLVTDVVMPGIDGIALAIKVQELSPSTKVLYISGYPITSLSAHGLRCAQQHLLHKPFTPQELAIRVRSILDQ